MKTIQRLTLCALFVLCSLYANAYDFSVESDGVTLYYNILSSDDLTCEVTSGNSSYSGSVAIPEIVETSSKTYTVVGIGERAFYRCTNLTDIDIPNSVTSIGSLAFYGCSSLTNIEVAEDNRYYYDDDGVLFTKDMTTLIQFPTCSPLLPSYDIPNSVLTIEDYAFYKCEGLTSLTLGNRVTTIGERAFFYCSGLTGELKIPDSVKTIGDYAFYSCEGLTSLTLGNNVEAIGKWAFYYCRGLTGELKIPDGVTEIEYYTFYYCSRLTSLTLGKRVTTIGKYAFYYCSGLTGKLKIPDSVKTIGDCAFWYCEGLTSLTLGNHVETIGEEAFRGCMNLTEVLSLNPTPPTCDTGTFSRVDTSTCVLYVPKESIETYSTTAIWEDFYMINDIETSGIETLTPDGAEIVGYYGIDGKQFNAPQRGINIIRYSDGTTKKILVK